MSKYLPDKQKTNLATIRAAFAALEHDLDDIRASIEAAAVREAPELPADIARTSDIPAPQDLTPICQRVDELTAVLDKIVDTIPDDTAINTLADARAGAKVGPVKGRLTQLWNDLAAEKTRIDDIESELPAIRTAAQEALGRSCPSPSSQTDLSPVHKAVGELSARLDDTDASILQIVRMANEDSAHDMIDDLARVQSTIREDLSETRRWVADLGRSWQRHRSDVRDMIDAIPAPVPAVLEARDDPELGNLQASIAEIRVTIDALRERIPDVSGVAMATDIPDVSGMRSELAGVRTAIQALSARTCPAPADLTHIETRLAAIEAKPCPPPLDLSEILARLDAIESRQCPAPVDLSQIQKDIATLSEKLDAITGGE